MGKRGLSFGVAAMTCSLLLLALRWAGRNTHPGDNDFDPVPAAVMFGSIAIAAPAAFSALIGFGLSVVSLAHERPVRLAAGGLASNVIAAVLLFVAWNVGP